MSHDRLAVILAPAHDKPTKSCLQTIRRVSNLLTERGFEVVEFIGGESARGANVAVTLYELSRASVHVSICFVAAHGSARAITGRNGEPIIDKAVFKYMKNAIAVLTSCLTDGVLPKEATTGKNALASCIGFKDECFTFLPSISIQLIHPQLCHEAKRTWNECAANPVQSLLHQSTSAEACESARQCWFDGYQRYADHPEISMTFMVNFRQISLWGNASAKLS